MILTAQVRRDWFDWTTFAVWWAGLAFTRGRSGRRPSRRRLQLRRAKLSNDVSVQTGSNSDNYAITVSVTDTTSTNNPSYYPSSLPTPGFQFDSSSTAGASSGAPETNYGMIYSYYVPAGGYAANGNITAHSDTVMGDWAFQYDTLNRLTLAAPAENAPSSYIHAVACFGYDGFGNRTKAAFDTSSSDCSATAGTTTASYTATNQVSFVSQSSPISYSAPTGFVYDGAGNVVQDGKNTYAYDGEGRLCAVTLTAGGTQYQYLYDAEGLRVGQATFTGAFPAKNSVCAAPGAATNFSLTKQYLLDQGGDQVTELTGTGVWKHSNVWAGAHLQATYDTVGLHYYLADPLGTKRVQANITGQTEETCQSLPFGDNLSCSQTALATADDATEHHFTGKERDAESGNDYFGARYYASSMGRFMSPDWSAKAEPVPYAKLDNPQGLNLYAYMLNNPLKGTDPDGHDGDICKKSGADCSGASKVTQNANGTTTVTQGTTTPVQNRDANGNVTSITTTSTITTVTLDKDGGIKSATQDQSVTNQKVDDKGNPVGPTKDVSGGFQGATVSQSSAQVTSMQQAGQTWDQKQSLGQFVSKTNIPLSGTAGWILDLMGAKVSSAIQPFTQPDPPSLGNWTCVKAGENCN